MTVERKKFVARNGAQFTEHYAEVSTVNRVRSNEWGGPV